VRSFPLPDPRQKGHALIGRECQQQITEACAMPFRPLAGITAKSNVVIAHLVATSY